MTPKLAVTQPAFLAEDFDRIGDAVLDRAARIDGHRLVLSGVTGFFGRNLLALFDYLHRRGARFEVVALSRDPHAFVQRAPWAGQLPWLTLRQGDVARPWPVIGRHDLLLHAATDTHAAAHRDLSAVFEGMLAGTREALACAERIGARRLLLTGSGAQYAPPSGHGGLAEHSPACDPMQAGSAYGEAKRVGELLAALHAQRHGTAVVATRCFAFVGPGLALDGHFAIGNFIADALQQRPIKLTSAGLAVRSYLYGADLAIWLLLLLLDSPGGSAVNVGSDAGISVRDLAQTVRDRLAPELEVQVGPEQPGEQRPRYVPDIARARALGLDIWTPLPLAIDRTAQWHRRHTAP